MSRALSPAAAQRLASGMALPCQALLLPFTSKADGRQLNDRLLLKWIQESGIFQFVGCLGRRVEFKDAITKRQAVWEYAPDSSSAKEALAVCEALHRRAQ